MIPFVVLRYYPLDWNRSNFCYFLCFDSFRNCSHISRDFFFFLIDFKMLVDIWSFFFLSIFLANTFVFINFFLFNNLLILARRFSIRKFIKKVSWSIDKEG